EETARISDRRHSTNNLFLSVNSILLGVIALLFQQSVQASPNTPNNTVVLLFLAGLLVTAGAVLSLFWRRFLVRYDRRLKARFDHLRALEQRYQTYLLPAVSMQQVTESFSRMEAWVPIVFLCTYAIAVGGAVAFALGLPSALGTLI